jgi:hypothetical protein
LDPITTVKWRLEVEEDFVLEDFVLGLPPICGIFIILSDILLFEEMNMVVELSEIKSG